MEAEVKEDNLKSPLNQRQLILSHRNLRELDATTIALSRNYSVEYLDLSHNRITKLDWIYEFPHLKCLIMVDNRLREAHLEKLKVPLRKITTLTLNKNELSDLDATAKLLAITFPNLQYLSLHGNPMCPDNLLLQPFSEFVPYEYNHYRTTLSNSLTQLKFLDHFSLDSFHVQAKTLRPQSKEHNDDNSDLWSKLKSFITSSDNNNSSRNSNKTLRSFASSPSNECNRHCASGGTYSGIHSEGNRYITNSDL